MTVVEFLTFDVPPAEQAEWLRVEEIHWSRFLEQQPGFEGKQIWHAPDEPSRIHAVIWWESMEHWKAIPDQELEAVAAAMGDYERAPVCTAYNLVTRVLPPDRRRPNRRGRG